MATYKIKLVKSLNGRLKKHIATAESLGLHKIGQSVVKEANDSIKGQINKVKHLVAVEEI